MKRNLFTTMCVSLVFFIACCYSAVAETQAPDGLMVELLSGKAVYGVTDKTPEFGWVVHSGHDNDVQASYRILVSSNWKELDNDKGDMWDSGKVVSSESLNVPYEGKGLDSNQTYYWKVKTWCKRGGESEWSDIAMFKTGKLSDSYATTRYKLVQSEIAPVSIKKKGEGHYLIDFGKVAFGFLRLDPGKLESDQEIEVHFGERGDETGVNKNPGGTVRYYKVTEILKKGVGEVEIRNPKDGRNTGRRAIALPEEIGVISPFRYVELVNFPGKLTKNMITQIAVHYPFDEKASSFESSSEILNDIWDLCKYSMKATSFCGVYVDGDRERIPYEADAYINQLSHYAVDREYTLARYSHEYLLENPTWPTEWKQHSILMAWADYMYTGNTESLAAYYDVFKEKKTLEFKAGDDGLLRTDWRRRRGKPDRDIVDWPPGERDGFVFTKVNTVVNAFYYETLLQMADIAAALGKDSDASQYRQKAAKVKIVFNEVLFDKKKGLYVDGVGTDHSSLHANMMPLAFGLVPEKYIKTVSDFVVSKGMACSVYGAQYLLEGLYEAGRSDAALDLMTSKDVRSWYNMLRVGSTITLEAWDNRFKSNQDWNHAWGAVPGNIIPRFLMGVRPLEAGFAKVLIQPQPGDLKKALYKVPTIRGPVKVSFRNVPGRHFELNVDIPVNMTARISLPIKADHAKTVIIDGRKIKPQIENGYLFVDGIGSGSHEVVCK